MRHDTKIPRSIPTLLLALGLCAPALTTHAAVEWNGSVSTDWHTGDNWSGGAVPGAGADVVISTAGGGVQLSADTAALGSLSISNNVLTFSNWDTTLNSTDVTVWNNGKFALPGRFRDNEMSNRVHVACVNLTIQPGGTIDADEGGYYPEDGPGAPKSTTSGGDDREGGGGYGGRGGSGDRDTGQSFHGPTYGDPAMPLAPGSGGGSDAAQIANAGGGGGAIYVDASGTVQVHGTITADGGDSQHAIAAAGSGGGIYISCGTFGGSSNGLIRARGGDAFGTVDVAGGGGGGRIAVDYTSVGPQHDIRFSCSPARTEYAVVDLDTRWFCRARMGTLWLPDSQLLSTTLKDDQFTDCRIMGVASWSPTSLTVSNCSVAFGTDGFRLDVSGDVRVDSGGKLGFGHDYAGTNFFLRCGNDLIVTNGGSLWVYAGRTNSAGPNYGALVSVTNDVVIGPASWIHTVPQVLLTNGGAPRFVMGNLLVAKGGGISANGTGYGPTDGPGAGKADVAGGGHGGHGGSPWGRDSSLGGVAYGSAAVPVDPGSSSSCNPSHTGVAGAGGGVIWLEVSDTVTIHGTLTAKGAPGLGAYGGPGSGGSVYLKCNTFGGSTNGLITVQGGDQALLAYDDLAGAGAGGRIALDYQALDTDYGVAISTAPGDEGWATVVAANWIDVFQFRAQAGTLWLSKTDILSTDLSGDRFRNVRVFGPTSWSPASLSVSNCWLSLCEPGFELNVAGDVLVGTNGVLGIGDESAGTNVVLRCQGDLTVTNGGALHVYAGAATGTPDAYGALVAVTNTLAVGPGSSIYPYAHSTDGGLVKFTAGDVIVAHDAAIYARGRGYASNNGPGRPDSDGSGGGGGAYGGRGGMGYANTYGYIGFPYGSPHQPLLPGSPGGFHTGGHSKMGGRGGGVVWIETDGDVIVDGTIDANGQDVIAHTYAGGGSGGGIYIKCHALGGSASGLLTADGGDGVDANHGGGGGGRVAVDYGSLAPPHDMRFSVAASETSWAHLDPANYWQYLPRHGSLSLPDAELLSGTLPNSALAGALNLWFQDVSEWAVDNLTISNGWVGFGQDDFVLTVSNDLVITTGGELGIGEYAYGSNTTMAVGGSLILTNGGKLSVFGGLTNAMGEGDVSAVVTVTHDMIVRDGSWVYPASHDTDGGSPVFRMRHLLIETNAGFNANAKGYRAMAGPGHGTPVGSYGYTSGGGYGGKGGGSTNEYSHIGYAGGVTYGLTNGPALPGSGGGTYSTYASDPIRLKGGGVGGGAVRIEAQGNATIYGTITANGTAPLWGTYYGGSGGAGGGISVIASNFSGNGGALMQANGADSYDQLWKRGAGGGGRVVVWNNVPEEDRTNYLAGGSEPELVISDVFADYWGTISTDNGQGSVPGDQADPGTAYYIRKAAAGTWELRIDGDPDIYDSPGSLGYGVNANIPEDSWITNAVTSPTDEAAGQRWACLGFALEDSDGTMLSNSTSTQAVFQLTTNMVLTWQWTNQWLLATDQGANGTVNTGAVNGWYTNGVTAPDIVPSPAGGYIFNTWAGDFPPGHATDDPLSVTMDQARWITGTFAVATIETNVWTGTGTWGSGTNWSMGHAPKSIDHAVIGTGEVTIDVSKYMTSLIVSNGATLLFTNWTTVANVSGDITVQSNGLITCYAMVTNGINSNRVALVCSNLTVEAGGAIDVKGKGYAPWDGPGSDAHIHNAAIHSGGSYGGLGGWGAGGGGSHYGGSTYGTANAPILLGSGGGSRDSTGGSYPDFRGTYAGWGGGAVRIDASETVTINGTVGADGGDATDPGSQDYVAAGSGGSIYITCATLRGSEGAILARGGSVPNATSFGGAGGGGRIAVDYQDLATPRKLHFSAAPGGNDWGRADEDQRWPWAARMGTLWLPDTNLLASPITDSLFSNCSLVIDGVTSLAVESLTVSNSALTFAEPGFELVVENDLLIGAGGELGIGGYYGQGSDFSLSVGGNITLTNGGRLHVHAGVTNGTAGEVATLVAVTNDLIVGPSSWIVPYCNMTNGSTVRFVAENIALASAGGVNARGRGYSSRLGPGASPSTSYSSGGCHGGIGGTGLSTIYRGTTYGSLHAPIQPGSSSGTYGSDTHMYHASPGGGVVRLEARGALSVNGTIDASAAPIIEVYAACGSGGSVYLQCDTFGGSGGLIRADGGSAAIVASSGPGGGGRIALDYNSTVGTPIVAFSATGGDNGWATDPGSEDMRVHHRSQAGTLSLPDTALLSDTLTEALFAGAVRLYFTDVSSWTVASLTVSDCSVNFADDAFALTVTGDVRVDGGGVLGIGDDDAGTNYVLSCANLTVTNGGVFNAHAGLTNNPSVNYGTLIQASGTITVGPSSQIHPWAHRTNGGTVLFRAGNVTVAAGAAFNATGRGYYSWYGPGRGANRGDEGAGGGFGGRGGMGKDSLSVPGEPYGSTNAPMQPGSAGGTYGGVSYVHRGPSGGGAIRIDASGVLTLEGTLAADGADAWVAPWCGGASGGAIQVLCRGFVGPWGSRLYARGGGGSSSLAGGGGGGRIAIWEGLTTSQRTTVLAGGTIYRLSVADALSEAFEGGISVVQGSGYAHPTTPAQAGTIRYFLLPPPPGTMFLIR